MAIAGLRRWTVVTTSGIPTGLSDYLSRWWTVRLNRPGDRVVDASGATLPFFVRQRPDLHSLTVLVDEPRSDGIERVTDLAAPFPVSYRRCDISRPWPVAGPFDLVIHTDPTISRPVAAWPAGVEHAATFVAIGGRIVLSVPAAIDDPPATLRAARLAIEEVHGVAPPTDPVDVEAIQSARFGADAVGLYRALRRGGPDELVGPLIATAPEVLYACRKLPCQPAPGGTGRS